jgi:hypothetical protein
MMGYIADLTGLMFIYLPDRVGVPPLPASARSTLRDHLVQQYGPDVIAILSDRDISTLDCDAPAIMLGLVAMTTQRESDALRSKIQQQLPLNSVLWKHCQRKVRKVPLADETCAQLADGQEMMACGRVSTLRRDIALDGKADCSLLSSLTECGAVRYCSKEHQLADWNDHKKVCFRPTW